MIVFSIKWRKICVFLPRGAPPSRTPAEKKPLLCSQLFLCFVLSRAYLGKVIVYQKEMQTRLKGRHFPHDDDLLAVLHRPSQLLLHERAVEAAGEASSIAGFFPSLRQAPVIK
jgi:hypothetical protein